MESLLPNYLYGTPPSAATSTVAYLFDAMDRNDMDGAMSLLQKYLSTIPYTGNTDYEGHWQQLLYVIFSLLGDTTWTWRCVLPEAAWTWSCVPLRNYI